jgi:hypothetical protein
MWHAICINKSGSNHIGGAVEVEVLIAEVVGGPSSDCANELGERLGCVEEVVEVQVGPSKRGN